MKLAGDVQLTHRLNPSAGACRPRWSNLAIGKDSSSGELYLSCHSNLTNSKYKIMGNIERVFMKFAAKGLATIRFREPAHDLSINCKDNVASLKSFLIALRQALQNKEIAVPLSSLAPTGPIVKKAKTSLTITERSAYPILSGFPKTLESLSLNIQMERFDRRIVRLTHLKILNLSDNRISVLPEELGELSCLVTLVLSGNRLGEAIDQDSTWTWMESHHMNSNLQYLDIGSNKLQHLPACLSNLKSLVTLKLDGNSLMCLPDVISTFKNLKYLGAGGNKLSYLPESLTRLRLEHVDISGNSFVINETDPVLPDVNTLSEPPSLFERAARTILNKQVPYPKSRVPKILRNYLNSPKICGCGSSCFEMCISVIWSIDRKKLSPTVVSDDSLSGGLVPVQKHFCSKKCFRFTWIVFKCLTSQRSQTRGRSALVFSHQELQRRSDSQMIRPSVSHFGDIVTPWMQEFMELYNGT